MIYKAYTKDGRYVNTAQNVRSVSVDWDCVYLYDEHKQLLAAVSIEIFGLVESMEE